MLNIVPLGSRMLFCDQEISLTKVTKKSVGIREKKMIEVYKCVSVSVRASQADEWDV